MPTLREVLNARPKDRVIAAPGVYDMVSLRMAAAMGFDALYMTGYGTVASHLGLPDAGLASYADMVGRVEAMARMAAAPLIADGDTGYGGLLNVRHTVRGYERAGAAAIQLEDQEFPKKCGHTPDRRVIPAERDGPQDRGRGRSARKLRFSHHRPHRRANFAWPERRHSARPRLRRSGGGHPFRRVAGDGGRNGHDRPRARRQAAHRQYGRRRAHADVEQRAPGRDRLCARHLSSRRPAQRRGGAGDGLSADPRTPARRSAHPRRSIPSPR